jgi:hypothetical protein
MTREMLFWFSSVITTTKMMVRPASCRCATRGIFSCGVNATATQISDRLANANASYAASYAVQNGWIRRKKPTVAVMMTRWCASIPAILPSIGAMRKETSLPYASEESIGLQPVCIRIDPRTILVFAEKQLLNPAQELVNFHRRGQETIAVQNAGGDKLAFRNEIAQAKQRNMAKIVI